MANDRLYIKCNFCGESIMLAKYDPIGFGQVKNSKEIELWLNKHLECRPDAHDTTLNNDPGVSIVTE